MSGSSLDGLDLALYNIQPTETAINMLYISGKTVKLNQLKYHLERIEANSSVKELLQLEADYSNWIAQECKSFIDQSSIKPQVISVHGHTVSHLPEQGISCQLANGGIIAALTELLTVTDFRRGDIALRGKGTPLTPLLDRYCYSQYDVVMNLGGIANISYDSQGKRYGYDIYPCNQVFNYFAAKHGKSYDRDGIMTRSGRIDTKLYNFLTKNYRPEENQPFAIDNLWIRQKFIPSIEYFQLRDEDKMHTFCHVLCDTIVEHLVKLKATSLFVTGGGIHHLYLRELLESKCGDNGIALIVPTSEETDYKECQLMALMAYLRLRHETNILSTVTGATRDSIGGAVYLP